MHQGESVQANPPAPLKGELPPQRLRGAASSYVFAKPWANSYTPLGFPRGEAGRLDGSSEPARLTEEGWRQPKYCLHFVQWYQPKMIANYFSLFKFIYHMENGFYKTSTLFHSPNPS